MGLIGRILIAVPLLLILSFVSFGFLATFEPGPGHLTWRLIYGAVGVACLTGLVAVMWRRSSRVG